MEEDGVLFSYRRSREGEERGAEIRAGMETEEAAGTARDHSLHQGITAV